MTNKNNRNLNTDENGSKSVIRTSGRHLNSHTLRRRQPWGSRKYRAPPPAMACAAHLLLHSPVVRPTLLPLLHRRAAARFLFTRRPLSTGVPRIAPAMEASASRARRGASSSGDGEVATGTSGYGIFFLVNPLILRLTIEWYICSTVWFSSIVDVRVILERFGS